MTSLLKPASILPTFNATVPLFGLYRAVQGEHPDWDDFRRAMVAERRLVLRLHVVERVYGMPPRG